MWLLVLCPWGWWGGEQRPPSGGIGAPRPVPCPALPSRGPWVTLCGEDGWVEGGSGGGAWRQQQRGRSRPGSSPDGRGGQGSSPLSTCPLARTPSGPLGEHGPTRPLWLGRGGGSPVPEEGVVAASLRSASGACGWSVGLRGSGKWSHSSSPPDGLPFLRCCAPSPPGPPDPLCFLRFILAVYQVTLCGPGFVT